MHILKRYRNFFITIPAFGLDISDKTIKFVWLKGEELELQDFGELSLPPGLLKDGEVKDEKGLSQVLRDLVSQRRLPRFVAISIPEQKGFVRTIQLPFMEKDEIRDAIKWELEANIPIPLPEALFDFDILPSTQKLDHLDINVIALPLGVARGYINACELAGLTPMVLELEPQAIARAVVPTQDLATYTFAICDFGATKTGIAMVSSAVRFTASRSISGDSFTEILAQAMKISPEQAEEKKQRFGISASNEGRAILGVLAPHLQLLVREIRDAVEFYQSHTLHTHGVSPKIHKVYLCGGGANLNGLASYLSRELGVLCQRANPWVNILPWPPRRVPRISADKALGFTTALGLALRGVHVPLISSPLNS